MGTPRVKIVTDSTADLPPALAQAHGIHVIPQVIIWGTQTYRDQLDIDHATFYRRLRTEREFPKTSQPSVGAFQEAWHTAAPDPAQSVLSIHVSGALSGTVATAQTARQMVAERTIEIIDSRVVTAALGYVVLAAARAAADGADLATCAAAARAQMQNVQILFGLDTLEYLHRGGRIGGAARLVGTLLNFKPILQVQDGRVEPLERARTRAKVIERMLAIARERVGDRPVRVGVVNVDAAEDAARLGESARQTLNVQEFFINPATPAIGAHTGPGTLGLALCPYN